MTGTATGPLLETKGERGRMVTPEWGEDGFAAAVADLIRTVPQRFALFLDLDGTLIDIAPEPHLVVVPPTLVRDLMLLCEQLGGAVAILSGRPLQEVDKFLAPLRLAGVGVHGPRSGANGTAGSCFPTRASRKTYAKRSSSPFKTSMRRDC